MTPPSLAVLLVAVSVAEVCRWGGGCDVAASYSLLPQDSGSPYLKLFCPQLVSKFNIPNKVFCLFCFFLPSCWGGGILTTPQTTVPTTSATPITPSPAPSTSRAPVPNPNTPVPTTPATPITPSPAPSTSRAPVPSSSPVTNPNTPVPTAAPPTAPSVAPPTAAPPETPDTPAPDDGN